MEKLKANEQAAARTGTQATDSEADEVDEEQVEAHVEPAGNCRLPPNVTANGNPFKRPMNALQKQWYRVLLARRVGFGQRVPQDEKEVT